MVPGLGCLDVKAVGLNPLSCRLRFCVLVLFVRYVQEVVKQMDPSEMQATVTKV